MDIKLGNEIKIGWNSADARALRSQVIFIKYILLN